jgi:hypothetical protein
MIAALSFLHPALLWGLALGGVPILLHLLQRRRYRVRRWAAMEFLRSSVRQSSRRLRIEQWLLLLVRALILILAALALARPVWHAPSGGWFGARAAAQVVIVLDDSYSMGRRMTSPAGSHGERTQFEWAKAKALELVRSGLTPGDAVSLVLASQPARALVRWPTFNLREIADQVQRTPISDRGTDLAGAARLSLDILQGGSAAAREVYLVTDLQAIGWRQTEVAEAWRRVAGIGRLQVIPTPPGRGSNLAVDQVRVAGAVTTGREAPIQARVSNWGALPVPGVMVTLHADGRPVASTRVDLPASGSVETRFEHAFPTSGAHTVMVSLPDDPLPVDNRGYASVVARDRIRALVLNGRPDPDPRRDAAFFLSSALAPDGGSGADSAPGSPFVLQRLEGSSFRGADLSQQDVVILADVPRLAAPDRRALARFAAEGGGILILPGPSALPAFYNGDLLNHPLRSAAPEQGGSLPALMPARLGPARDVGEDAPALDLAHADHPALSRFRGAADVDLTTARFQRYFRLQPLDSPTSARVVCRFTDGSVAMAERPAGLGRVCLLAFPLSPDWNTLPFKPAFLPFLHGLISYLGRGPNRDLNVRVGEPLVWAVEGETGTGAQRRQGGDGSWTLEGPGRSRVRLQPQQQGISNDPARIVRLESAPRAGFYRLVRSGAAAAAGDATTAWFAANLNTDESDLRTLTRPEWESRLRPASFRWVDPQESMAAVVQEARKGREAWRGLLLAAVALMLCESGLAQMFGRRRSYV